MISKTLQKAINEQIVKEFYSEYLYQSMRAWFADQNLEGFANWMNVQQKEEHCHGLGFYQYLLDRGGRVLIGSIPAPPTEFKSPLDVYEQTYAHELLVTKSLGAIMDMAKKENDHAAISFLQWYVDEQVEEESNDEKIIKKLKMIKTSVEGLMLLDQELAARMFVAPVISGMIIL
jgi:ferritin